MKFAEPIWLIIGLAAVASLFWLYRHFDKRQRAALAEFASSHLLDRLTASFSPGRRRLKRALFATSILFICVALARPQWGYHWEEQKQRGIDILFAVDTSKSMLTQDVTPDRLTRAKLAITDFVRKLDGDRVGLIAFAGDAFLQAPLTLDYDAFQESLDAVDTNTIPRGGTDISSAIDEAQAAFGHETKNKKILVLLTDGEDLEAKGIDSARAAAKDGLVIYTIGVGSASGGLIPVPGANGGTDFVKDASGQFVKSHLDESTLKQIAEVTGGLYEPLGQQGEGLRAIYNQALASMPKQDLASRSQKVYNERFQWPLSAALLCLFASLLIGTRRSEGKTIRLRRRALQTVSAVGIFALAIPSGAHASPQAAEQAYKKGDYATAEKQYEQAAVQNPQTAPLQFNLGAASYKTGDYAKALPAFQKALDTDQIPVQQQAYYDMGNTQYRVGQKTEKSSPEDTIKTWQAAIQSYDAALKLKSDDTDAKFNRDFVQKKLDELQKQQQQKQDQQKQDQKNQKDQKQDQQNQSGSSQSQDNQANQQKQNPSKGDQAKQDQKQSGSQQNQAQNGKPGQPDQKGQQGQPKDRQAGQQQQTAGKQGDQSPAGNQGQPQGNGGDQQAQQTAQNQAKPAGPRGQTIPDKNQGKVQTAGNDAETAAPGEMTKQDAQDLLNSLKNSEHALPVTADARSSGNHPPDAQTFKDW
jgi:Ca-activated chloride channel family protein